MKRRLHRVCVVVVVASLGCAEPPPNAPRAPVAASPPLDIAAVRAKLAALPDLTLSQREVCALTDAPGFQPPAIVILAPGGGEEGWRLAAPGELGEMPAVVRCASTQTDRTVVPQVTCDAKRPVCFFGLVSGETVIPPSERRYWFAKGAAGKLEMVAVAVSLF